jgi:hypothetical protein
MKEGTMVDASATTDRAKEQVQEKAQVAQEKLGETTETMRARMREQVDQRSTQAGGQVRSTAQALRSTSERLREDGQEGPAKAAERAADQAEKIGGWLEQSDADRILHDVEDFGRRQPLAVAAIGLAAGFAMSRFLKASSRSRYQLSGGYDAWERRRNPAYPGEDRIPSQLGGGAGGVASDVPATGVTSGIGTGPTVPPAGPTTGLS